MILRDQMVHEILHHLKNSYIGPHGVLVTQIDGHTGKILDNTPLVADFGDVLPFAAMLGEKRFVRSQIDAAQPFLRDGLYAEGGVIHAFYNHDYLLGLIDLAGLLDDEDLLIGAENAADALNQHLLRDGYLLRQSPSRPLLDRTSPFNGGFIELYIDLAEQTGRSRWIDLAQAQAERWISNRFFKRYGLFRRVEFAAPGWISDFIGRLASEPLVRLMKDNSNLVAGLIALYRVHPGKDLKLAILHWLSGLRHWLIVDGDTVMMNLSREFVAYQPDLRAATAAIETLLDVYQYVERDAEWIELAQKIAERWLMARWDNGLLPLEIGGDSDHIDANLDFAIALVNLSEATGQNRWTVIGEQIIAQLVNLHELPYGYAFSINEAGKVDDSRIIIKYQGLLLKLTLIDRLRYSEDHESLKQARAMLRDR